MSETIRQPAPKSNHFRNSGDELRYSQPCADNRCGECEWDANECDCAHHLERGTMATEMTTRDQLVKKLAYEYVCFNHDPNTKYLVVDVTDDCMIELEGMSGLFAPDLFQLASMAQPAPGTSGEWRVQAMPTHGWRVVDATEQEIVADVYREEDARQIVSDHNAVPSLVAALKEALVEAEVSTVLWQQSRGFVGTVEDAYDKGLMPPAFVRARAVLAAVGREGSDD